jgi:hypothetical protein
MSADSELFQINARIISYFLEAIVYGGLRRSGTSILLLISNIGKNLLIIHTTTLVPTLPHTGILVPVPRDDTKCLPGLIMIPLILE